MTESKVSPTWFTQTTIADVAAANYRAKGLELELRAAAAAIESLTTRAETAERERDEAREAIGIVQRAAKSLAASKDAIIDYLQKGTRAHSVAVATMDSERAANATLTAELEESLAECERLRNALHEARPHVKRSLDDYLFLEVPKTMIEDARATLRCIDAALEGE